ncbi:MAG: hypothetical protein MPK31_07140 [Gammaproteobacteria bacterium]|nr:hypothetical protein [Gammaproteobacteria bacterium]MDA8002586.1 hypothetical protein [Alphaproteobacteria bacterium]
MNTSNTSNKTREEKFEEIKEAFSDFPGVRVEKPKDTGEEQSSRIAEVHLPNDHTVIITDDGHDTLDETVDRLKKQGVLDNEDDKNGNDK